MLSAYAVQDMLAYSAWASRRLVDAAAQLPPEQLTRDFGTADKSVLGTLVHVFAADRVSQKRAAMGEPQKRGGTDANQQKAKASAPTLAHSGIFPSTFGDMHGQ